MESKHFSLSWMEDDESLSDLPPTLYITGSMKASVVHRSVRRSVEIAIPIKDLERVYMETYGRPSYPANDFVNLLYHHCKDVLLFISNGHRPVQVLQLDDV